MLRPAVEGLEGESDNYDIYYYSAVTSSGWEYTNTSIASRPDQRKKTKTPCCNNVTRQWRDSEGRLEPRQLHPSSHYETLVSPRTSPKNIIYNSAVSSRLDDD